MKLLIAGDFCPMDRVARLIEKEDYDSIFGEIIEYTQQTDYSIVNLEAPIVETEVEPIKKNGPNLKCSSKSIKALKFAGFDMVTLANNHFYDYGDEGVKQTIEACKRESVDFIGGGMDISEASKTLYIEIKCLKIAIINCCEHEFSIATDSNGGANPLNPIQQYYEIIKAKQMADKVIVIVHGGHEHYQLPSLRMKETYRFFIDVGADAVINHHQHCFSGYEIYKEKLIVYGLGNFSFNRDNKTNIIWNKGYMVLLNIDINKIDFEIIPYIQGYREPGIVIIKDGIELDRFWSEIESLNMIIEDDVQLNECHKKWMKQTGHGHLLLFEPYENRILSALYNRKILPSLNSKRKWLKLLNYLECESHIDKVRFLIKNKLRNIL